MKRLLWIGDAGCDTGFARCTHHTLEALRQRYEIEVLGINYRGDPHSFPYPIYPAWSGGDMFGIGRLAERLRKFRPHVMVIQNDPWNIPAYVTNIEQVRDVPRPVLIGAVAIDGKNCRGWALNGLDHCIFWTRFAQYEALRGGYTKTSSIVPLGVDLEVFKPGDRRVALDRIGLPEEIKNGFIVGNVNRNQPRKRLDLTIRYFAEWIRERSVHDAFLFLHVAPTGDIGYDCDQLAGYYGLHGKIIMAAPEIYQGVSEEMLACTYQGFDAQINTGVGEGWGLTTMEGMACGVPQVVGDWSGLGEWPEDAVIKVPCEPVCGPHKINVIGGEVNGPAIKDALDLIYRDPQVRDYYRTAGCELVARPEFRWPCIAVRFTDAVDAAVERADA